MTDIDTSKHARDMTPAEYAATLAELKKGQPKPPQPSPEKHVHARDMSDWEKSEWFAEHRRRWR
jgi:hypothetical protein